MQYENTFVMHNKEEAAKVAAQFVALILKMFWLF